MAVLTSIRVALRSPVARLTARENVGQERYENKKVYKRAVGVEK
jgi:hypothetical protein